MPDDPKLLIVFVSCEYDLEIEVIAEGIESGRQAGMLHRLGFPLGQGFYYSPPLPTEEVSTHVASRATPR